MGTRVTVVGEALVDLLWRTGARELSAVPGGSPANVAVGLHRLERPVTLLTAWGDDPPGALVNDHLVTTGVEVRRVPADSARTIVALAYLGADGAATYDFLADWAPLELPVPEDTTVLHTGSLAVVIEPGASRVLDLCRRERARGRTVAADLNVRPAVQPDRDAYREVCLRLAGAVDVVKASDEDLAWLFPDREPAVAARALLAAGPRLVVVTLGAEGAFAVTAEDEVRVAAPVVDVVDTVGAGDTFQATLLDAIAENGGPPAGREALAAVLARCAEVAAVTCTRVGADPPYRAELTGM
ncbi:carbohydrate kinase family protein [Streptomyces litchfieldiae]|uniref:Carbohydrate kinase n=1 Tax=Streptomyces litchfieldiae TaxID=3075543 RepID=A0ABU2MRW5_9ACTN|nr:carbohydrate kinase [Streptomyces sp. DSM 44938]MDT0344357.1 carbohydrate kinase [Streptomyces sp. DSM 44938]